MLGIWALVVAALSASFELRTGTYTRITLAVLLVGLMLGLWAFRVIVEKQRLPLIRSRTVMPLLFLSGAAALAFLIGQLPWFLFAQKASLAAQLGGLAIFVLAAGAFLLVGKQVTRLKHLEWMVWLFLGISAVYVIGRLSPVGGGLLQGILNDKVYNHSLFWLWLVALSFSQAAFNTHLRPILRVLLGGLTLATLYISLGIDRTWTSGWLPGLIALGVILWASNPRWIWALFAAGAAGAALKMDSIRNLLFGGDNTYSLMTRLEAWRILGEIIKVSPVFGLGPSNYYWYTPLYSILGWSVQFNSHNNYIDLLAQTGILGLVFFLWFAVEAGRLGLWLRDRVPGGFARAYVLGALGGLAGTLVAGMLGDWFLPFIYNIGLAGFRASLFSWIFLGGLVALEQMVRNGGIELEHASEDRGANAPEASEA
jgi:O-antigen ligase